MDSAAQEEGGGGYYHGNFITNNVIQLHKYVIHHSIRSKRQEQYGDEI